MRGPLTWDAAAIVSLVGGAVFLAVAIALFLLAPGNRGNRTYALALFLYGLDAFTNGFLEGFGTHTVRGDFANRLNAYAYLTSPLALLYFILTYPSPPPRMPRWLSHPIPYVAAAAAVIVAWIAQGATASPQGGLGGGSFVDSVYGYLEDPMIAFGGYLFIRRGLAAQNPLAARSLLLIGVGLSSYIAWNGAESALTAVYDGIPLAAPLGPVDDLLQLAIVGVSMAVLVLARRHPSAPRPGPALAVILLALVSGVVSSPMAAGPGAGVLYATFFLLWLLFQPAAVVYAIVRHQFFDLDLRFRRSLSRGILVLPLVVTLIVASQLAEGFAQTFVGRGGWILGALAAAALLVFLSPFQRWADRLAARAVPSARPFDSMTAAERAPFYQQQYMFALSDGRVSADERRMLDFARRRLGIDAAEARRLEADASRTA